jgi:hypothetical protein
MAILSYSDVEEGINITDIQNNISTSQLFVSISDCSSDTDLKRIKIDKTVLMKRLSDKTVRLKRVNSGEIRYNTIKNLRSNEGGEQEDYNV